MKSYYFVLLLILVIVACKSPVKEVVSEKVDHMALGDSIALASQQALLMEVGPRLQSLGPIPTLKYCNVQALPILDSLSMIYGAQISRISSKNRNPGNAPTQSEEKILDQFEKGLIKTALIETVDEAIYYKAIHLDMPACIKCHGKPGIDIQVETLRVIDSLYPGDFARDYQFGDFRGAWKIQFKKD